MANKTIYVKDEDLQLFEEAEKLGGDSLSSVIAEALRRFVDVKRAEVQGMKEHILTVGVLRSQGADDTRKVRFVGRLLAEAEIFNGQTSDRRDRGAYYRVYQTRAGKVLVWWEKWSCWEGEPQVMDYVVLDALPGPGYDDEVVGKVHGFPEVLPGELLQEAAEALGQELVEFIE